jgi:hypothetical protein
MSNEYNSTIGAFEDFLQSSIWRDMKYELECWVKDIQKELEAPERTPDIYLVRQLQGNLETVRKVLQMPLEIIENIKEDFKRKEKQ